MKKAAVVVLLLAGVAAVAGEAGIMDGFGNFVADVQAEDELPDNEKAQNESEEVTGEEEDSASKIDTSITIGTGSRIAVVSKATDGEYWKLVHRGMEDAVKDINTAYDFSSDDAVTMTFEGPSDEQDVETQINTLDAVIAENPTVLCMSASDIESCQAQLEAASENGIPVVVFDSNVRDDELVAAFLDMVENHKMIVENSGLLTVAALKHLDVSDKRIVSILSGGNMDVITMSSVVQQGLILRDRIFTVSVLLPDKPGELCKVSGIIAAQQGNVIKLEHNQFVTTNRSAAVELRITLECFGTDHKKQIIKALEKEGYKPKVVRTSL